MGKGQTLRSPLLISFHTTAPSRGLDTHHYMISSHKYFSAEKFRYPDSARQLPSLKSYMYSLFNLSLFLPQEYFHFLITSFKKIWSITKILKVFHLGHKYFSAKKSCRPRLAPSRSVFEVGSHPDFNPTQISTLLRRGKC